MSLWILLLIGTAYVVTGFDVTDSSQTTQTLVLQILRQKAELDQLKNQIIHQNTKIEQLENEFQKIRSQKAESNRTSGMHQRMAATQRGLPIPVSVSASLRNTLHDINTGSVVTFDNMTVNDGGAYRSGIFYAPQSGVYFFAWNFLAETGYDATLGLHVNGAIVRYSYSNSRERPIMAGNNGIVRLNVGDRVWLATYLPNASIHHNLSAFSAFWLAD